MLMNYEFGKPLLVIFFSLTLLACSGSDKTEPELLLVVVEPVISQFSFLVE
jgi:hypothetical protein